MSLLEDELNKAMRDAINLIINDPAYKVIEAQQSAPRPVDAYCSVHVVSVAPVGWEEQRLVDQPDPGLDIDEFRGGYRDVLYSLNFYRDGSMDKGLLVQAGLMRNSLLEYFKSVNLGLGLRSDVRDISEILSKGWEPRAQLDITLSAVGTDQDIITSIQTVTISGELQPFEKGTPIQTEVTIP